MSGTELKQYADREGITAALARLEKDIRVELPLDRELMNLPITELNLSVRAHNALMRAHVETVEGLANAIMTEPGIEGIRNLGRTSVYEIKTALLTEGYRRLSDGMKLEFWDRAAEVNKL